MIYTREGLSIGDTGVEACRAAGLPEILRK